MITFLEICEQYDGVGFDLDGTLYDEFFFIDEFYHSLALIFDKELKIGSIEYACKIWSKFGSSYQNLFQDLYTNFYIGKMTKTEFIKKCLINYQSFKPNIKLTKNSIFILESLKKKELFIVTDGNHNLQSNKIEALQVNKYVKKNNIFFTGKLGKAYYKPSTKVIEDSYITKLSKVIFFGDRYVDKLFALNSKFDFRYVKNMELVNT